MAKKTPDPRIGRRVELHPGCDLWMRGAKFGIVKGVKDGVLLVRMDSPRVRQLQRLTPDRVKFLDDFDPDAKEEPRGLGYMQGRGAS